MPAGISIHLILRADRRGACLSGKRIRSGVSLRIGIGEASRLKNSCIIDCLEGQQFLQQHHYYASKNMRTGGCMTLGDKGVHVFFKVLVVQCIR